MRKAVVVLLGLVFALVSISEVKAQSKKKGKEPELAICKRGKLIFEDDFSGKELEWNVVGGEWKIVKKALVTKTKGSPPKDDPIRVERPFTSEPNVVFQFRLMLTKNSNAYMKSAPGNASNANFPSAWINPPKGAATICHMADWAGYTELAVMPLPFQKPRWLAVTFEMLQGRYALTVDGRTITAEVPMVEPVRRGCFNLLFGNPDGNTLAIDDVKVYEALPRGVGVDKDEKDKKKK